MSTASTIEAKKRHTPEDLLAMPDAGGVELVDGQLVENDMGSESSWVAVKIIQFLSAFCEERKLGWVFGPDAGYQCFPDAPDKVRKPDVSFIRFGRLAGEKLPKGHIPIAPDLAVEIVSPHESATDTDRKVKDYLSAGTTLVWVVNPEVRIARVHRADGPDQFLAEDHELIGENVLPGFRCAIRDILPPRDAQTPSAPGNA